MKDLIFVSSVQKELADERRAIRDFVHGNRLLGKHFDVFLFEDLPAKSRRPDDLYLDRVEACSVFLALFGAEYGWEDPKDGVSPTEREFDRATHLNRQRLLLLKNLGKMKPHQPCNSQAGPGRHGDQGASRDRRRRTKLVLRTGSETAHEWLNRLSIGSARPCAGSPSDGKGPRRGQRGNRPSSRSRRRAGRNDRRHRSLSRDEGLRRAVAGGSAGALGDAAGRSSRRGRSDLGTGPLHLALAKKTEGLLSEIIGGGGT